MNNRRTSAFVNRQELAKLLIYIFCLLAGQIHRIIEIKNKEVTSKQLIHAQ